MVQKSPILYHTKYSGCGYLVGPDAAVVGSLGSREAALGPSEGVLVLVQDGVLLLDAEPRVIALRSGGTV